MLSLTVLFNKKKIMPAPGFAFVHPDLTTQTLYHNTTHTQPENVIMLRKTRNSVIFLVKVAQKPKMGHTIASTRSKAGPKLRH